MDLKVIYISFLCISISSCSWFNPSIDSIAQWERNENNPVYRDIYESEAYQSASDGHVFFDENDELFMIYSGDVDDKSSIKLAKGNSFIEWTEARALLSDIGPSGKDVYKETSFYRKSKNGKHQIYYIGYPDEESYEAEIYLAESENLQGPYTQMSEPIISKGEFAGREVYCMTSPSVMEHNGELLISFLGWDNSPSMVRNVWVLGATSNDDGLTWSDFKIVDSPIGMEGQITKSPDGSYVAVRTDAFRSKEAIYYATADHPHGPWSDNDEVILIQDDSELELNEVIAPSIVFDPDTGEELLFYTGADYSIGWWMMLATRR